METVLVLQMAVGPQGEVRGAQLFLPHNILSGYSDSFNKDVKKKKHCL